MVKSIAKSETTNNLKGFVFFEYEKPKNAAKLMNAKIKHIGYASQPNVPTIQAPSGKTFLRQANINASEKTIRLISPTTFRFVIFIFLLLFFNSHLYLT